MKNNESIGKFITIHPRVFEAGEELCERFHCKFSQLVTRLILEAHQKSLAPKTATSAPAIAGAPTAKLAPRPIRTANIPPLKQEVSLGQNIRTFSYDDIDPLA